MGDLPPNGIPTQGKFGYDSAKRRGIAVVAVAAAAAAGLPALAGNSLEICDAGAVEPLPHFCRSA